MQIFLVHAPGLTGIGSIRGVAGLARLHRRCQERPKKSRCRISALGSECSPNVLQDANIERNCAADGDLSSLGEDNSTVAAIRDMVRTLKSAMLVRDKTWLVPVASTSPQRQKTSDDYS